MGEIIGIIGKVLDQYILFGYGLFSILTVIFSFLSKRITISSKLDEAASFTVIYSGILYLFILSVGIIIEWVTLEFHVLEKLTSNKIFDADGFSHWIHFFVYLLMTQLLWIKKIRRLKFPRFVLGVIFIFSLEKYVIIVSSAQRDFLPDSWVYFSLPTWNEILGFLLVKISVFILLVTTGYYIREKTLAG